MAEGTYRYASGDTYTGTLRNGLRDGQGVFVKSDGDRLDGMWRQGVFHGEGVATFRSGVTWSGTFDNGRLVNGTRVDAKGNSIVVESIPRLNKLTGQGTETTVSGERYEGDFVNGLREGHGALKGPSAKTCWSRERWSSRTDGATKAASTIT
jgi:hypothetical protein